MTALRCDDCGKFCATLQDVWRHYPQPTIDREVCDRCFAARGGDR